MTRRGPPSSWRPSDASTETASPSDMPVRPFLDQVAVGHGVSGRGRTAWTAQESMRQVCPLLVFPCGLSFQNSTSFSQNGNFPRRTFCRAVQKSGSSFMTTCTVVLVQRQLLCSSSECYQSFRPRLAELLTSQDTVPSIM